MRPLLIVFSGDHPDKTGEIEFFEAEGEPDKIFSSERNCGMVEEGAGAVQIQPRDTSTIRLLPFKALTVRMSLETCVHDSNFRLHKVQFEMQMRPRRFSPNRL